MTSLHKPRPKGSKQHHFCPPMGNSGKYDVTVIGDPQRQRLRGGCAEKSCRQEVTGNTGFFDLWLGSSAMDDCSTSTITSGPGATSSTGLSANTTLVVAHSVYVGICY